jgi:phosphoribosylaminoimidazole carboxylase
MKTVGIIGGGQLGRMLIEYGIRRLDPDVRIRVMNPTSECSCSKVKDVEIVLGDFQSEDDLRRFATGCDVITWEIEHVNVDALQRLEEEGRKFIPSVATLRIIQDKATQKEFYHSRSFKVVDYELSANPAEDFWGTSRQSHLQGRWSDPVVYKSRRAGYDGRGVWIVPNAQAQPLQTGPLIIERFVKHRQELSVIVVRSKDTVVAYDAVEMTFHEEENILDTCRPPATIPASHLEFCKDTAIAMSSVMPGKYGLYAFEMFYVRKDDSEDDFDLYLNEVACRVHNSGHHTIHTHDISQFEMLARLLLDYPIRKPRQLHAAFGMRNLFCNAPGGGPYQLVNHMGVESLTRGPFVIDYGKGLASPWRKLGHITHVGSTQNDVDSELRWVQLNNVFELVLVSTANPSAIVGVVMGSDSDWQVMVDACRCLSDLEIPYEVTVVSAHRTPDRLAEYAKTAASRGIRVIIAGAGGAAHLPGMIAAHTATVPVIGVPVKTVCLNGLDSLYSIVQMPPGVPVGCMSINGARNAAIFAAQIVGSPLLQQQRDMMEAAVMRTTSFRNYKIE